MEGKQNVIFTPVFLIIITAILASPAGDSGEILLCLQALYDLTKSSKLKVKENIETILEALKAALKRPLYMHTDNEHWQLYIHDLAKRLKVKEKTDPDDRPYKD